MLPMKATTICAVNFTKEFNHIQPVFGLHLINYAYIFDLHNHLATHANIGNDENARYTTVGDPTNQYI